MRKEGPEAHFSWFQSGNVKQLIVRRGGVLVDTIEDFGPLKHHEGGYRYTVPGNAGTAAQPGRHGYGVYRYTFTFTGEGGTVLQTLQEDVDFGRLAWDRLPDRLDGYRVYVARTREELQTDQAKRYDAGMQTEVSLLTLLGAVCSGDLSAAGGQWWFAVASYAGSAESPLSETMQCTYQVELE